MNRKKLTAFMIIIVLLVTAMPFGIYANADSTTKITYTFTDGQVKYSYNSNLSTIYHADKTLQSVVFEGVINNIPKGAFENCTALSSVVFKGTVHKIDENAFQNCTALPSVTFEGYVGEIGEQAFHNCIALSTVTFEGAVGEIGERAFEACTALSSVTIEGAVGRLGDSMFNLCVSPIDISFGGTLSEWHKIEKERLSDAPDDTFILHCNSEDLTLVAHPSDGGSVAALLYCDYTGTVFIRLSDAPEKGYRFINWTNGNDNTEILFENANDGIQYEGKPIRIQGNFKKTYSVTVVGGVANSEAVEGDKVGIIANEPEDGMYFMCWESDDIEDESFEDVTAVNTTFDMPEKPVEIRAVYKQVLVSPVSDQIYTGDPIEPEINVKLEGSDVVLENGKDYDVEYSDNENVGTAKVIVTLKGDWVGNATASFEIILIDISEATVTVDDQIYDNKEKSPVPTVTLKGRTLTGGIDYDITAYTDNKKAGNAAVTLKGKGTYTGTTQRTFKITKRPLILTADSAEQVYNGKALAANGYTSSGLADGDYIESVNVKGSRTDAGESENVISDVIVRNSDGEDVTDCYSITFIDGKLTVVPAKVTITVQDAYKEENENDPVFSGNVEGLVAERDLGIITYERTGSEEAPGTYSGVLDAVYTENPNYDVTVIKGDFTIREKEATTPVYMAVKGDGGTYIKETEKGLSFTFRRSEEDDTTYDHFLGINVDGIEVPMKDADGNMNWTADKGSVVIELNPSYLNTLSAGQHQLAVKFDDGEDAAATFTVMNKSNTVKTGEKRNIITWLLLIGVSCAGLVLLGKRTKITDYFSLKRP